MLEACPSVFLEANLRLLALLGLRISVLRPLMYEADSYQHQRLIRSKVIAESRLSPKRNSLFVW